jgi:hypothetical protein
VKGEWVREKGLLRYKVVGLSARRTPLLLLDLLLLLLLGHASEPVDEESGGGVEGDEAEEDAKVTPAVGVVARDGGEEDVGVRDAA